MTRQPKKMVWESRKKWDRSRKTKLIESLKRLQRIALGINTYVSVENLHALDLLTTKQKRTHVIHLSPNIMNRRINVTSLRPIATNYMKVLTQIHTHKINIDRPENRHLLAQVLTRNQISSAKRIHEEIARLINEINKPTPKPSPKKSPKIKTPITPSKN